MSGFQPRAPLAPPPRRRLPAALVAAGVLVLAAAGFLVLGDGAEPDDQAGAITPPSAANSHAPAAARSAPYATPVATGETAPGETLEALGAALSPVPQRPGGYVVSVADAALLAGTPLRAGDVLFEIDGQKLDAARMKRLADELGRYEDVWVSFERDGKPIEMLLELK
ncbi:MAG: hypothetical protein C0489_13100 [Candidatus Accumulibacter sp.]|nr:hypothetical protein [Accumulibacter sp.]